MGGEKAEVCEPKSRAPAPKPGCGARCWRRQKAELRPNSFNMDLSNNTVLVTGGASGIGLALAARFHQAGSEVIVCGRRADKLAEAQRQYPGLPSMTVKENHGGTHIHPHLNRVISAREMARLQTFPDTFLFEGTMKKAMWQIGNAVPPRLAECIGLALIPMLNRVTRGEVVGATVPANAPSQLRFEEAD